MNRIAERAWNDDSYGSELCCRTDLKTQEHPRGTRTIPTNPVVCSLEGLILYKQGLANLRAEGPLIVPRM